MSLIISPFRCRVCVLNDIILDLQLSTHMIISHPSRYYVVQTLQMVCHRMNLSYLHIYMCLYLTCIQIYFFTFTQRTPHHTISTSHEQQVTVNLMRKTIPGFLLSERDKRWKGQRKKEHVFQLNESNSFSSLSFLAFVLSIHSIPHKHRTPHTTQHF